MTTAGVEYPASLSIDYPDRELDRLSTALRIFYVIPILILFGFMTGALAIPAGLMILFRRKYPRWFFDFNLEITRFSTRIGAYFALMSDVYPSTDEEQYVHLDLEYPDAERLNRWLLADQVVPGNSPLRDSGDSGLRCILCHLVRLVRDSFHRPLPARSFRIR